MDGHLGCFLLRTNPIAANAVWFTWIRESSVTFQFLLRINPSLRSTSIRYHSIYLLYDNCCPCTNESCDWQQKEQKMDTLIKTSPILTSPHNVANFRLKNLLQSQPLQAAELWMCLTPEQQQQAFRTLVIVCRQIVQRLPRKEEQYED